MLGKALIQAAAGSSGGAGSNIVYVGGRTIARRFSDTNAVIDLTVLTGGIASSPSQNDVVIFNCGTGSSTTTGTKDFRVTAGYTMLRNTITTDTCTTRMNVAYKFMGATPDTVLELTGSQTSNTDVQTICVQVFRYVDTVNPFNFQANSNLNNLLKPTPPPITPSDGKFTILCAASGASLRGTQTFVTSQLSNFITTGQDNGRDSTSGMGTYDWTSETFTPVQWQVTGLDENRHSNASITVAMRSL